jgi:hypothetical protein
MQRYNAKGIPHAFLLDRDFKVVWQGHPASPEMESALDREVRKLSEVLAVKYTSAQLNNMSVKELKHILIERHIQHADCLEKGELVARIVSKQ